MCFSASASFIASGTLATIGTATLRKAKNSSEKPLASLPVLFGIQQFIEGTLWLAFQYQWLFLQSIATFVFSLFAYALWPAFVPFAVWAIEKDADRRKIISIFWGVGSAVALYLLYFIIKNPVSSQIMHHSIRYTETVPFSIFAFWVYTIAGVGSCLISSHKIINFFGIFLFFSIGIAYYFYAMSFTSVWCFFAAILSIIIYFYFVIHEKVKKHS